MPNTPTTEALVKIFAYNNLGNAGWDTSDFDFRIVGPMYPPSLVTGEALPSLTPNYVRLYWNASTSESYSGYYVYRGITLGAYDPSPISGLVVGNTYDDATVVPNSGINYYYAVVTFSMPQKMATCCRLLVRSM